MKVRPGKPPNPAHFATQRMADRLTTEADQVRYRRRKAIVEPVLGGSKRSSASRAFTLRGEAPARGEWNMICLAVNLKRLHRVRLASAPLLSPLPADIIDHATATPSNGDL